MSSSSDAITHGAAFRLGTVEQAERALDHLTHRECELGGYELVVLRFHSSSGGEEVAAIAYVATRFNRHYITDEAIEVTARTIANATGKAGTNREYLEELIKWHVGNGLDDEYLTELGEYVARETDLS